MLDYVDPSYQGMYNFSKIFFYISIIVYFFVNLRSVLIIHFLCIQGVRSSLFICATCNM